MDPGVDSGRALAGVGSVCILGGFWAVCLRGPLGKAHGEVSGGEGALGEALEER